MRRRLPACMTALVTATIETADADDDRDEQNTTNDTHSYQQSLKVHCKHTTLINTLGSSPTTDKFTIRKSKSKPESRSRPRPSPQVHYPEVQVRVHVHYLQV